MSRFPAARRLIAAGVLLRGAPAAAAPHPCVQPGDSVRPVAGAPGQPRAIAVVTTRADAVIGRTRAWVGDTVQRRCLGFVETAVDAPSRWIGFAPRPWFVRVMFPGATDSARGTREDAVLALVALPPWSPAQRMPAAQANAPAADAPAADATLAATPTAAPAGMAPLPNDAIGARFIRDFREFAEKHWQGEGANWAGNYYDRALIYYQAWRRFGIAEYRRRADTIAVDYRTKYLEKNNYNTSPHWAQMEGLAEHYRLTHDEKSRTAVLQVADRLGPTWLKSNYMTPENGESRIAARVLQAQLLAWQLADRADKPKYAAVIDGALAKIAAWQQPDGSYPAYGQVCGGQLNYMVGLLNDVLIKTYESYRADPKILAMVKRATDYLWTTQWLPSKRAFQYASVECPHSLAGNSVGGRTPAPDLNNMMVTSFGWLYRKTGDARYRTEGEQVFAGGVEQAFLQGTKQFNEEYTSAFRYLDYR